MNYQENYEPPFFRFEELRIYSKSLDFSVWMYNRTEYFPSELRLKLLNCVDEIATNIAEGSARNKVQFVHYLKQSKTNVRQCVVLLSIAERMDLLNKEDYDSARKVLMELTKMLGAFITSINRNTKSEEENNESENSEL